MIPWWYTLPTVVESGTKMLSCVLSDTADIYSSIHSVAHGHFCRHFHQTEYPRVQDRHLARGVILVISMCNWSSVENICWLELERILQFGISLPELRWDHTNRRKTMRKLGQSRNLPSPYQFTEFGQHGGRTQQKGLDESFLSRQRAK